MTTPVAVLLCLGLALLVVSWWLRAKSGVPVGEITYSDTDAPAQALFSNRYRLVGKPDYIVLRDRVPIPIEVKPNRTADAPYESDRMQVAAYCLLVEETNARTPPFGVLRYRSQSFRIDYTPELRAKLLDMLGEMRACLDAEDVERSHDSAARCAVCGFSNRCEERLGG